MAFPEAIQTWTDGTPGQGSAARFNDMERRIQLAAMFGISSTPPGSPVDGMLWRLPAASSIGVFWVFQYDSSQATNKWVFVGGAPWLVYVAAVETTASTTYTALTTAGPSIAIPRAGDYLVEQGCYMRAGFSGASALMSYDIGGTGAIDADAVEVDSSVAGNGDSSSMAQVRALTAVTLASKYRVTTANAGTFGRRWLKVTPIRII